MIKLLILIIVSAIIVATKGNWDLPICNLTTAKQAIAPRIFAEQTVDSSSQPIVLTRFLHNKLGILGSELTRCYFYSFDPNFIYHALGIGLFFWLYFFYFAATRKLHSQKSSAYSQKSSAYIPLLLFLIIPALPIFALPLIIVSYAHKIFAIIGLAFFLFKKK